MRHLGGEEEGRGGGRGHEEGVFTNSSRGEASRPWEFSTTSLEEGGEKDGGRRWRSGGEAEGGPVVPGVLRPGLPHGEGGGVAVGEPLHPLHLEEGEEEEEEKRRSRKVPLGQETVGSGGAIEKVVELEERREGRGRRSRSWGVG